MNKTFRGLIADNTIQRVRLSTNDGLTGYKINKLQILQQNPGNDTVECLIQVHTIKPTAASTAVNFDDPTLVAVAYYEDAGGSSGSGNPNIVINDSMIFNQDVFISYREISGSGTACNYYLELEQVKLDVNEATVATLKDMRGRE
jgi:hypothetical protein